MTGRSDAAGAVVDVCRRDTTNAARSCAPEEHAPTLPLPWTTGPCRRTR